MPIKMITPNTNVSAGSINTNFLKDAAVTVDKMAANSVDSDQYVDGSIDTAHIGDDQVTLAKISTTGASNEQVLQYNSTSGNIEWADAGSSDFDPANAGAISNTGNILPAADNTWDIGSPSYKYNDIYAETFQGTAVLAENLNLGAPAGDILTYQDSSNRWKASSYNTVRNFFISGTPEGMQMPAAELGDPVLKLVSSNSGWDKAQVTLVDSNDDAVAFVGRTNNGQKNYQFNFTLDPNNTKGRTNVGGTGNTFPGDYFVAFEKDWSDQDAIQMTQKVFGANDGFFLKVFDDSNGTSWSDTLAYNWKPINFQGSEISCQIGVGLGSPVEQLKVEQYRTSVNGNLRLHVASSDPTGVTATAGDLYFNNSTNPGKVKVYNGTAWEALH
jgi:hypothetical protein